jgi:hypothetical protein
VGTKPFSVFLFFKVGALASLGRRRPGDIVDDSFYVVTGSYSYDNAASSTRYKMKTS